MIISVKHNLIYSLFIIRLATCFDPVGSSSGLHCKPFNVRKLRAFLGSQPMFTYDKYERLVSIVVCTVCLLLHVLFVLYVLFVAVCIVCFVSFSVLFVRMCLLYYCHRVATQLQLNIYRIISYIISMT